jgi:hypothetical protein
MLDDTIADFNQAITGYTRMIELNPDNTAAYAGRGFAYYLKDDRVRDIADDKVRVIELERHLKKRRLFHHQRKPPLRPYLHERRQMHVA